MAPLPYFILKRLKNLFQMPVLDINHLQNLQTLDTSISEANSDEDDASMVNSISANYIPSKGLPETVNIGIKMVYGPF